MITSLQCDFERGVAYKSPSQIARVVTEHWCARNLYCAACNEEQLQEMAANTRAFDFRCRNCSETYQVKSQRQLNFKKVADGAYSVMVSALKQNVAPNILVLNYSSEWTVKNLVLFPSVVFTEDVLEKRRPLTQAARRAGWVGCNIVLSRVPNEAQISLVSDTAIIPANEVREQYRKYSALASVPWELRGWTLDVLNVLRRINAREFDLTQVYAHEIELTEAHPENRNVKAKIRQQMQILRDLGLVKFLGNGRYRAAFGL
ncbi:MAG TPA: DpnI domain-containing protein [Candidatus Acidoferrales bacterium]|nr:DpnI domain-containing protein [Candidatus Acidoferrales bacterium]